MNEHPGGLTDSDTTDVVDYITDQTTFVKVAYYAVWGVNDYGITVAKWKAIFTTLVNSVAPGKQKCNFPSGTCSLKTVVGYNVILFPFVTKLGDAASMKAWTGLLPTQRQDIKNWLHGRNSQGVKDGNEWGGPSGTTATGPVALLVSVGGELSAPPCPAEPCNIKPTECTYPWAQPGQPATGTYHPTTSAGLYATLYNFDGVDFDLEGGVYLDDCPLNCTTSWARMVGEVRYQFAQKGDRRSTGGTNGTCIVTSAPQTPYFATTPGSIYNLNYVCFEKYYPGPAIPKSADGTSGFDFYNIQFYNQNFQLNTEITVTGGNPVSDVTSPQGQGTAPNAAAMIESGIPPWKIVLGKCCPRQMCGNKPCGWLDASHNPAPPPPPCPATCETFPTPNTKCPAWCCCQDAWNEYVGGATLTEWAASPNWYPLDEVGDANGNPRWGTEAQPLKGIMFWAADNGINQGGEQCGAPWKAINWLTHLYPPPPPVWEIEDHFAAGSDDPIPRSFVSTVATSLPSATAGVGIYIVGGWTGNYGVAVGNIDHYDPSGHMYHNKVLSWPLTSPNPGEFAPGVALDMTNQLLYIVGGAHMATGGETQPRAGALVFSLTTQSYTTLLPMPTAVYGAAVAFYGDKLFVVGGMDASDTPTTLLQVYDGTIGWTSSAGQPNEGLQIARAFITANMIGTSLYITGGVNIHGPVGGHNPPDTQANCVCGGCSCLTKAGEVAPPHLPPNACPGLPIGPPCDPTCPPLKYPACCPPYFPQFPACDFIGPFVEILDLTTQGWVQTTTQSLPEVGRWASAGVAVIDSGTTPVIYTVGGSNTWGPHWDTSANGVGSFFKGLDPGGSNAKWSQMPVPLNIPRYGCSMVVFPPPAAQGSTLALSKLYVFGGQGTPSQATFTKTIESYPSIQIPPSAWVPIAPMGTPRIGHGIGRMHTLSDQVLQVYAVGGQDGSTLLKSAEVLLAAGWKTIAPMSTARVGLGVAFLGTKLYAAGGWGGSPLASVEVYDTGGPTWTWTDIAPMSISRSGVGVASLGSYLYAVGGLSLTGSQGAIVGSAERYSPSGGWANINPMQTPREGLGVAAVGLFLYAVGGTDSNGTVLASVERYDPTANVWASMTSMGTARHLLGVAALGGLLYAVGGKDSAGNNLASVEVYDPATNTWDQPPSSANPLPDDMPRWGPGVTVSLTKLYVVGGGRDHRDRP